MSVWNFISFRIEPLIYGMFLMISYSSTSYTVFYFIIMWYYYHFIISISLDCKIQVSTYCRRKWIVYQKNLIKYNKINHFIVYIVCTAVASFRNHRRAIAHPINLCSVGRQLHCAGADCSSIIFLFCVQVTQHHDWSTSQ